MLQPLIHYGLHFGLPLFIALVFYRDRWKMALVIMLMTMAIDLDHLLANPVFDANRCSINFHPLHTYYAIMVYIVLALIKKTRLIGIGILTHIIADSADCYLMQF